MTDERKKKGFALLTEEQRKELGRRGGRKAHANGKAHVFTSEEARAAGMLTYKKREGTS